MFLARIQLNKIMGIVEQIAEVKAEIARTQKNKATEHHLGRLKAKLARLESQLIGEVTKKSGGKGSGFDVVKQGQARIALVGFPSVGKSTFLTRYTNTESASAAYEFTTLTCVPGTMEINGAPIQILDLPGIIEGAATGLGKGRQVIATARTSDAIIMMLNSCNAVKEKKILTKELESMGIRLNRSPPNIELRPASMGGIQVLSDNVLTILDHDTIRATLTEYKLHNCQVLLHCDATVDDLIDVVEGNRVYMPCIYVINKVDMVSIPAAEYYAKQPDTVVISAECDLNVDYLKRVIWKRLQLVRIYTRKRNCPADLSQKGAVFLKQGDTVEKLCANIHNDMVVNFSYAMVWGRSAQHCPQRVGKDHQLADEDVVQIVLKK